MLNVGLIVFYLNGLSRHVGKVQDRMTRSMKIKGLEMKQVFNISGLLLLGLACSGISDASSDVDLEHKLNDLSTRVLELERRLNALESPEMVQLIEQNTASTNPGDSQDQSNWNRLKIGYNYDEVRELLGEPVMIKKGSMEFWYYSERKLDGPFVKFIFNKVHSWKSGLAE